MEDPRHYKCLYKECCKSYLYKWDLINHNKTVHEGDTSTKCNVCEKTFMKKGSLQKHIRKSTCQAVSSIINLAEYTQLEVCIRSSSKITELTEKHEIDEGNVQSRKGDQKVTTLKEEKQIKIQLLSKVPEATESSKIDVVQNKKEIENASQSELEGVKSREFSCNSCNSDMKSRFEFRNHVCPAKKEAEATDKLVEREHFTDPQEIEISNQKLSENENKLDNNILKNKCDICLGNFTDLGDCQHHKESKNPNKIHARPKCDKSFLDNKNLKIHIASIHDGKTFSCQSCSFSAPDKTRLRLHIEETHLNYVYNCPFDDCLFSTPKQTFIELHTRRSHGKLNNKCAICEELFPKYRFFKGHIYLRHGGIFCNFCYFQPLTERELQEHNSKKHAGISFSCTECSFVTSSKINLEMHKSVHTYKATKGGQKRRNKDDKQTTYTCPKELCKMIFCTKTKLEKHYQKLHSAILLTCKECSFESTNKMDLIVHKNEHDYYKWLHANGLLPDSLIEMSSSQQ